MWGILHIYSLPFSVGLSITVGSPLLKCISKLIYQLLVLMFGKWKVLVGIEMWEARITYPLCLCFGRHLWKWPWLLRDYSSYWTVYSSLLEISHLTVLVPKILVSLLPVFLLHLQEWWWCFTSITSLNLLYHVMNTPVIPKVTLVVVVEMAFE